MGTPFTDRNNLQFTRGNINPGSMFPPGSLRATERPLNAQFTPLQVLTVRVRNIPINNPTIAAGTSAWYGLKSWRVGENLRPCFFNGYRFELSATNPTAAVDSDYTTAGNIAAWGNADGYGAAVVIGINLGINEGQWSSGPNNIPFVETAVGAEGVGPAERFVLHFAPGSQGDTPRPFVSRVSQTTPLAIVLGERTSLDVALVVRQSQVNGVTRSDGIIGRIFGEIYLSMLQADREVPQ